MKRHPMSGWFLVLTFLLGASAAQADDRATIERFNRTYDRTRSRVMMRFVERPTQAQLDAAAYLDNALLYHPKSREPRRLPRRLTWKDLTFDGSLEVPARQLSQTPLTEEEVNAPMAWFPLLDRLAEWDYDASLPILELSSQVSSETWGMPPQQPPLQQIVAAYLHQSGNGRTQIWVEVEFLPGVSGLPEGVTDGDQDRFPEIYARIPPSKYSEALVTFLREGYLGRLLSSEEVEDFFYELASNWYEKYNTDTLDLEENTPWPNALTEPAIREQLQGAVIQHPTAIIKGTPFGRPVYNVFVVASPKQGSFVPFQLLWVGNPSPSPMQANIERWRSELARWGDGRWETWVQKVAPFREQLATLLREHPNRKGFIGKDGFLFFRGSIRYSAGGDLQAQKNNPFPAIVDYAQQLQAKGIDLLFVILPAKTEIYPDKIADWTMTPESPYVNPYTRKFLLELAEAGVEVVDLYPAFLEARDQGEEPLYMPLDTHWTNRGVRLAAHQIAERIKAYPWYREVCPDPIAYQTRRAESVRAGDIRGMLPENEKLRFRPMRLTALQVLRPDGTFYQDDPDSPIVVLGDSFTGVFHFEDCKHAGLTAHIAREIGMPVDLIMAHGSGPRIRKRLARRGSEAIRQKRLIIWTTAARDLYEYWAPWEKIPVP